MSTDNQLMVSVVIPTFNYGHVVCDAVESVLAQTYRPFEVIVVDDGSTDDTKERLLKYGDKIRYIYKNNDGLAEARNTGIKAAKGNFIAVLDSDDTWMPEKLDKQMRAFRDFPNVGLVTCNNFDIDEKGVVLNEVCRENFSDKKEFFRKIIIKNIVSGGSNAVIKKECFDKVGLFDKDSSEDWDMWIRISLEYDIRAVEEMLVNVRVGSDSMSSAGNAGRMLEKELVVLNKIFTQLKNIPVEFLEKKSESYSYRYFCAAWAYLKNQDVDQAFKHILKSFGYAPKSFLNKQQGGLMVRIFIEKLLRLHIPVNGLTRPVFNFLYKTHVFIRESLLVFFKFIYFEPLFRSQCESVGDQLWMEKMPYLVGSGKIVVGNQVRLSGKSNIIFSNKVYPNPKFSIGDGTFVGHNCRFAIAKEIKIGNHCFLAGGVSIADNDGHPLNFEDRKKNLPPGKEEVKPVTIGNDVWIGRGAWILKGITIGDRSIVGANAVVTKDVPLDSIVCGNPARILKSLEE